MKYSLLVFGKWRVARMSEQLRFIQAAIYKARWVDGIKDPTKATDESVARAVLEALRNDYP